MGSSGTTPPATATTRSPTSTWRSSACRPYSPELNPAERLFEEIRRHVEGRVYATLDDKVADVQAFLEKLDADPPRVRRLCGWDWINAAIASLPAPLANAA